MKNPKLQYMAGYVGLCPTYFQTLFEITLGQRANRGMKPLAETRSILDGLGRDLADWYPSDFRLD